MKLRYKYPQRTVLIFIIIAAVMIVSSILFIVFQNKLLSTRVVYIAKFADANGLSATSPVNFKGFKIGNIVNYKLSDDNYVIAEFEVFEEYADKIKVNSALYKGVNPVTNTSVIEFLQGNSSREVLKPGSLIPAIDIPEGKALLSENKVTKSGDLVTSLLQNLQIFTDALNSDNNPERGAIFRALVNFADASQDMKVIAERMNEFTTALGKDGNTGDGAIFRAINNVADLTQEVKEISGVLKSSVFKIDSLLAQYKNPDGLAQRMIDPTGEQIFKPMGTMLNEVNNLLPQVEAFVKFMNTQSSDMTVMIEDLKVVLKQVQLTFETVNSSPLINQPGEDHIRKFNSSSLRLKNLPK